MQASLNMVFYLNHIKNNFFALKQESGPASSTVNDYEIPDRLREDPHTMNLKLNIAYNSTL